MTVAELIEALSQYRPEAVVMLRVEGTEYDASHVEPSVARNVDLCIILAEES